MKISVHLKPNSRHREEVVADDDGSLTVYTKAPAIEGRANLAAVKLLAKHFGVASSKVNWCAALLRNTRFSRWIRQSSCRNYIVNIRLRFYGYPAPGVVLPSSPCTVTNE